ncbi:hypothetical protein [Pseudoalteromonas sp. Of7M-16]|uniref:hypothetical protein n=1 Tax=Pseudoalteromonas sp. Of7M-16 TaxID=2917756 RepID=UPI001EF4AE11|nr:hypothetical protein [Pseudoalteromonas sp. Of7M-16]MCG7549213.1 hypothetical protein [Pseudoalteromonas sp. Of7M-16]
MAIPGLIRNFESNAPLPANRFVAADIGDFMATNATGIQSPILGVTEQGTDKKLRVDVVMTQLAPIELGGDFAGGEYAVSDSEGRAIPLDPTALADDTEIHVAGKVLEKGDAGTIVDIHIAPFVIIK